MRKEERGAEETKTGDKKRSEGGYESEERRGRQGRVWRKQDIQR